jgi:enoyl-CoA hydratase/carnithine racemase
MTEDRFETIAVEDRDAVRLLVLDRPAVRNALNRRLAEDLVAALQAAGADHRVRAVVLTGAGERAFSAGADLDEASRLDADGVGPWFLALSECYRRILLVPKPVVAAVNGVAAGGGYQIALVSDWRIGCGATRMAQPEILAGVPSIMGSYLMTLHLPWALNQELSYTGRAMDAEECRRLRLLNELVGASELRTRACERAADLAARGPVAFRATKARFAELALRGFEGARRAAVEGMQAAYASGEAQAAMRRFLDRAR